MPFCTQFRKLCVGGYNDVFLWKEILRYAKKDAVFVTDDVKTDWWEMTQTQGEVPFGTLY